MRGEATIGGITVGGQPSRDELTSGRFRTVVNVRGAAEDGNDTAAMLSGSDVDYVHVPWTIDTVAPEDIDRMDDAIAGAEGGVLIHCAGGTRAAVAAAIIAAKRDGTGERGAMTAAAEAGYDVRGTPYGDFIRRYFTTNA